MTRITWGDVGNRLVDGVDLDSQAKGKTVPVIADYDQVVEIHWRLKNGHTIIERLFAPRTVGDVIDRNAELNTSETV